MKDSPCALNEVSQRALIALARDFSPRIETHGERLVTLDVSGLGTLLGSPRPSTALVDGSTGLTVDPELAERVEGRTIGEALRRTAAHRGLSVHVAMAATRTTAILLAQARAGLTVVPPGQEAAALAPLPLAALRGVGSRASGVSTIVPESGALSLESACQRLARWGLRTLGDLAALPAADLSERLGQEGVSWQRLARGEDVWPLVPSPAEEIFEESLDLEWPIEGLDPLSFVLGRLCEPLCARLERHDRGAVALRLRLVLVNRHVHERCVPLPAPMRDARVLRTLALLDIESHPPSAAIDRVTLGVDVTEGRVLQFGLFARALPAERLSILLARLGALMGADRVGVPALVNSHRPGAFAMASFLGRMGPHPHALKTSRSSVDSRARVERVGPDSHTRPRESTLERPVLSERGQLVGVGPCECEKWSPANPKKSQSTLERPVLSERGWGPANPKKRDSRARMTTAIRRFRLPIPARVVLEQGRPIRVMTDRRSFAGGRVDQCAGPWRTSGEWWSSDRSTVFSRPSSVSSRPSTSWDHDEWDVLLSDGAGYRLFHTRDGGRWFLDGILD